jgi:hypothetical protein
MAFHANVNVIRKSRVVVGRHRSVLVSEDDALLTSGKCLLRLGGMLVLYLVEEYVQVRQPHSEGIS